MPTSQGTYTPPNNFVQQYDQGQKKIRADLVDENFTDAAAAITQNITDIATAQTTANNAASAAAAAQTTADGAQSTADAAAAAVAALETIPVGTIIWSANATVPAGYLLCNGAAVGRATYPELFAAIGTAFGSGDGSTTFNLPNLIDKFIEGSNVAGTVKAAGLPNITGKTDYDSAISPASGLIAYTASLSGAFSLSGNGLRTWNSSAQSGGGRNLLFNASLSNPIYGNSTTVQPPAVTALPCIKY